MKVNAAMNANNWLTKRYVIKDLIGILAMVNDKSCYVGKYLDYKKLKCRKRLVGKLVEECSENIDEKELHQNKMIRNSTLND